MTAVSRRGLIGSLGVRRRRQLAVVGKLAAFPEAEHVAAVAGRLAHPLVARGEGLFDAVRGTPDDPARAGFPARGGERAVVLADVRAVGPGAFDEPGVVVDDERHAGRLGEGPDLGSEGEDVWREKFLGADLQDVHASGDHLPGGFDSGGRRDVAEVEDAVEPAIRERFHGKGRMQNAECRSPEERASGSTL